LCVDISYLTFNSNTGTTSWEKYSSARNLKGCNYTVLHNIFLSKCNVIL
jgi:hypothetical protein